MSLVLEDIPTGMSSLAMFRVAEHQLTELDNGNFEIKDFPVFRTGTFRDSMGEQRTWEKDHLAQMVSNFNALRDSGRFEDVPVRDGHPGFFGAVAPGSGPGRIVGYVTDIRVGGSNVDGETMLVADFELTEPDAVQKYQSGTFRARSSEIGMYETNDEALHWPVFLGFAFVDIGAVEKLFGKSTNSNHFTLSEDANMGTKPEVEETIDLSATENENAEGAGDEEEEEEESQEEQAVAQHAAAPAAGNFTFSIGGRKTTDFGAVQQHIDNLESVQQELAVASRNDFVSGLASSNVIPATQVEALQELVADMSPEQFSKFTAAYKDAPPNALFAHHDGGVTNPDGTEGTNESSEPDEMEILEQRVKYARQSGVSEDAIAKMASYQKLQKLKAAAN